MPKTIMENLTKVQLQNCINKKTPIYIFIEDRREFASSNIYKAHITEIKHYNKKNNYYTALTDLVLMGEVIEITNYNLIDEYFNELLDGTFSFSFSKLKKMFITDLKQIRDIYTEAIKTVRSYKRQEVLTK